MTVRVAILGGGPAGVGLARQIVAGHQSGSGSFEVELFEANPAVGGLSASFSVEGVVFDHGSHRLHPSIDPEILEVLQGLMPGVLQRRPRHGRIVLGGRFIGFPLRPLDAALGLPWRIKCGLLRDMFVRPRHAAADSFAATLESQLGPTLCREFYFPMARKLWGREPGEIDAEQARRRVSVRSPWQAHSSLRKHSNRSLMFYLIGVIFFFWEAMILYVRLRTSLSDLLGKCQDIS